MITVAFCHSPSLFGAAIRAATWSPWDHVGLMVGSGKLLSALPQGVCVAPIDPTARLDCLTVAASEEVITLASRQIGKPYDWTAVLGIGMHRDWRAPDSWFCSELVAWAFETAGCPLLRPGRHLNRITPGDLAMSPLLKPV